LNWPYTSHYIRTAPWKLDDLELSSFCGGGSGSDEDEVGIGEAGEGGGAPGGLTRLGMGLLAARSLRLLPPPLVKEVARMTTFGPQDARRGARAALASIVLRSKAVRAALASIVLRSKAVMVLVGERSRREGGGDGERGGIGGGTAIFVFMTMRAELGMVVGDGKSASSGRGGESEGFWRVGWGEGGGELIRLRLGLDIGEGRAGGRARECRGCA